MGFFVVTLGDPKGIGIEAISYLLENYPLRSSSVVIIGSRWQWDLQRKILGYHSFPFVESELDGTSGVRFHDIDDGFCHKDPNNLTTIDRGSLSVLALEAVEFFSIYDRLAVLTAPIDKACCREAGFRFSGQTEFFSNMWGGEALMVLAGPRLRVGLVTNHLALKDVPASLSIEKVRIKILKFMSYLRGVTGRNSIKVGVTGLNPHASDCGMFGDEEEKIIAPAILGMTEMEKGEGEIFGPIPADTAFFRGYQGELDGILAMYHDQGLAALKTVHFYDAVNISYGLRHLRVSPDHGPAQDLFLSGQANLDSFTGAWSLSKSYLERENWQVLSSAEPGNIICRD